MNKTFIFVFTGEFGYELLNWQGRIRKFSAEHPGTKIVCASTEATRLLYLDFAEFIPLDGSDVFNKGIADTYFLRHQSFKRDGLKDVITAFIRRKQMSKFIAGELAEMDLKNSRFIFSDKLTFVDGTQFGATRWAPRFNLLRKRNLQQIYDGLPSEETQYIELIPRESVMREVKKRILDMGITSPFVVVQNADRETFLKKRRFELPTRDLYSEISKQLPTVEISFRQIRRTDTQSPSTDSNNVYLCTSLEEQAAIIRLSSFCIFMSSGDFRSLHYVPSFCGRDNYSITSSSIISNSAIGLWNAEVFMFGGKIIPMTAESLIFDVALKNNFLGFCNSRL